MLSSGAMAAVRGLTCLAVTDNAATDAHDGAGRQTASTESRPPAATLTLGLVKEVTMRLGHSTLARSLRLLLPMAATALVLAPAADAAPPLNDNRADAQILPAFPATASGTTAEATVERLDPQVSDCGQIEGTVWYRIDQAPDGRIVATVRAQPGLAPVVRLYRRGASAISEVDCGTAADAGTAVTSVQTVRGAGYFILVGRRPGAGDGAFDVLVELFLPPRNDRARDAQPLGRLPGTIEGTTLGATGDSSDGKACGLAGGTVWYGIAGSGRRAVLRLTAAEELDASMTIFERVRSELEPIDCSATDRDGHAVLAVDTKAGRSYLLVVGERAKSRPGTFRLEALAAEAPEALPGHRLGPGAVNTVHGLTDVNDIWYANLRAGSNYLIAFSSRDCATVSVRAPGVRNRSAAPLVRLRCNDFTLLTPEPGRAGRYTFDVVSADVPKAQPYRLRVVRAGADDFGVGVELRNGTSARGRLAPRGADLVDIYHFDVPRTSDVTIGFSASSSTFAIVLLRDTGSRLAQRQGSIQARLGRGRYVIAVRGRVGEAGGRYSLSLHLRDVTVTGLTVAGAHVVEIAPATSVLLSPFVSPAPSGGTVLLRIERFDPLTGWHFHRLVRLGVGEPFSWRPPALGRWRVSASFLGTSAASPSRSGYVYLTVAKPIG